MGIVPGQGFDARLSLAFPACFALGLKLHFAKGRTRRVIVDGIMKVKLFEFLKMVNSFLLLLARLVA